LNAGICFICSKRRRKRGLPLVGDKAASKDAKKALGKLDAKSTAAAAGKPQQDVKKLHEAENIKSTAEGFGITDQTTEQLSLDDRLQAINYFQ